MKKLILTCAVLVAATMSFAQDAKTSTGAAAAPGATRQQSMTAEKAAEMRAKRYQQTLGLSDDQYKKVYDAELEYVKQDQAFRASGQPVPQGPAQQMMMAHDQKFQSVLSADQYAKYDKMRTANRPGANVNANAPATTH
jgi:hypothetical protein